MSVIIFVVLIAAPMVAAQSSSSVASLEIELKNATASLGIDSREVAVIRHALGHAYAFAGKNDAAILQWRTALSSFDKNLSPSKETACVLFDLALALQSERQFAESAPLWEREIELLKTRKDRKDKLRSTFAQEQLARTYLALKEYNRAESVLRALLTYGSAINPNGADLHELLGESLNGQKRYEEAKVAFQKALKLSNDKVTKVRAHLGLANARLMANGNECQAESELQLALDLAEKCQDDVLRREAVENMEAFYKLFGRNADLEALRGKYKSSFTTIVSGQNVINNRYGCGCDSYYRAAK